MSIEHDSLNLLNNISAFISFLIHEVKLEFFLTIVFFLGVFRISDKNRVIDENDCKFKI